VTQTAGAAGQAATSLDDAAIEALVGAPQRRLEATGVLNLRDVGGYPAAAGPVPWGRLLRSDALHRIDAAGVARLASIGVRTVVDLRTNVEAEHAPSALGGLSARREHISLLQGDLASLPADLPAIYRYLIEDRGPAIAAAIGVLAAPGALPALVHCSAGKDRTGIVIALVLDVAGVPDQVIAADYALTARFLDPDAAAAIGHLQSSTGLGESLARPLLGSPPELILDALRRVRAAHGSAEGYLRANGLTTAQLDGLRAALAG